MKFFNRFSKSQLILIVIILIGLFFRLYKVQQFYTFDHDQDLFSWIVKDIWVDHHIRLIGQETSLDGVYIGPFYYYSLIPFFVIFKMDPIGAIAQAILISMLSFISIYYVFKKLFSENVGLIGAFLYAVSMPIALLDRWVVPTQPIFLWSIWFLYALFLLLKGKQAGLIYAGVLVGLIWHIHVGLLPLTILIPIAIFLSKKKIKIKNLVTGLILFTMLMSPFWMFELRHGFLELRGFLNSLGLERGEASGFTRFIRIIDGSSFSITGAYLLKPKFHHFLSFLIIVSVVIYEKHRRVLANRQILLMFAWIAILITAQQISKRAVPEYYFNSIIVVSLLVFSLFITNLKIFVILPILLLLNLFFLITRPEMTNNYLQKKLLVEYISRDAKINNYPCVGIDYIAELGKSVGFRYLFWKNNLKTVKPNIGAPNYKIVIPATSWEKVELKVDYKFGAYGVISPKPQSTTVEICNNPNNQFLPLLGFTR